MLNVAVILGIMPDTHQMMVHAAPAESRNRLHSDAHDCAESRIRAAFAHGILSFLGRKSLTMLLPLLTEMTRSGVVSAAHDDGLGLTA